MIKSIAILGCGESGQYWDGHGESIGVNDCWKFGHPTDYLMVINPANSFTPQRRKIIEKSTPHHFVTDSQTFLRQHYDKADRIKPNMSFKELYCTNGSELIKYRFSKWTGTLQKDRIQYSNTSPFAAISLAYLLGYKEIILWGVDFKTHRTWKADNPHMFEELDNYKALIKQLWEVDVSVYLGHEDSLLYDNLKMLKFIKPKVLRDSIPI